MVLELEAPADPNGGDLWYNINDGRTYVYYDEALTGIGTARFWIDASPFNVGEIDIVNINADSLTISGASTVGNFVSSGTATLNNLSIAGVSTITGGVGFQADSNFTDNTKLTFGNGLDLRLYHDATHEPCRRSWIWKFTIKIKRCRSRNSSWNYH